VDCADIEELLLREVDTVRFEQGNVRGCLAGGTARGSWWETMSGRRSGNDAQPPTGAATHMAACLWPAPSSSRPEGRLPRARVLAGVDDLGCSASVEHGAAGAAAEYHGRRWQNCPTCKRISHDLAGGTLEPASCHTRPRLWYLAEPSSWPVAPWNLRPGRRRN
jgi:hypothetical protein